jgi:chorismate dehydratase
MSAVRVGTVPYLNARPLVFGFEQGVAAGRVVLETEVPSRLAARIAEGSLDVALLSSIELARIPGLTVVPGLAIGSAGPVRSVLLLSRVPAARIRTVAPDPASRTSNVLARLVLAELGAGARVVEEGDADAVVRIGDRALFDAPAAGTEVLDLGAAWTALTRLPFVYAVWAARPGVLDRELYEAFHASKRRGDAVLSAIAEDYTWNGRRDPATALAYFRDNVRYRLGEPEVAGLRLFLRRAAELGEAPPLAHVPLARFAETACDRAGGAR